MVIPGSDSFFYLLQYLAPHNTTVNLVEDIIPVAGNSIKLGCNVHMIGHPKEVTDYVWTLDNHELQSNEEYGGLNTSVLEIKVFISSDP